MPLEFSQAEELPAIEAKSQRVTVVRSSQSKRVVLFNSSLEPPAEGKLILLKRDAQPSRAYRVLKTYSARYQFAGKAVREYNDFSATGTGGEFSALEKVGDLTGRPVLSPQDQVDLKELESAVDASQSSSGEYQDSEIKAFDPELDQGTSVDIEDAAGDKPEENLNTDVEAGDAFDEDVSIQEVELYDTYRNWLSVGPAFLKNDGRNFGERIFYTALGFRYAYNLIQPKRFQKGQVQTSFALEGGFYVYRALALTTATDIYTVIPLQLVGRFNVQFSRTLYAYGYAGGIRHFVYQSTQGTTTGVTILNTFIPSFGLGLGFQFGPGWDLRFDFGYDMIGGAVCLRF